MFTLDQIKLVILENEKLQNEVASLKEQMAKQQSESVINTWKQRALVAEAQLEFINRKSNVEVIPQEELDLTIPQETDSITILFYPKIPMSFIIGLSFNIKYWI